MPLECMISKTNNGRDFPIAGAAAKRNLLVACLPFRPESVVRFRLKIPAKLGFIGLEERSNRPEYFYCNHLEKFLSF